MKRINMKTGETFVPHLYADGMYRIADPAHGSKRHHAANQIAVASLDEVWDRVRSGFGLRMRGENTGKINLIAASEIRF